MRYIMLVDDSDVIRGIVENTLKIHNYKEILTATNGKEALSIIKEKHKDIAMYVLDVNMPEMDGLTLLAEIRKIDKTAPIIMLTTESDKEKIIKAKEIGATGWIIKPFQPDKFIQVINMYMKD